jgi:hypothetical protein
MRVWSEKLIGDSDYSDFAELDFADVGDVYAGTYKVALFAIYQSTWAESADKATEAYCVPALLSNEFTLTDYVGGTYASIMNMSSGITFDAAATGSDVEGKLYINFGIINVENAQVPVTVDTVLIGDENTSASDTDLRFRDVETNEISKTIIAPAGSVDKYTEVTVQFFKNATWTLDKVYNLYLLINICFWNESGKLQVCNSWQGDLKFKVVRGTDRYRVQIIGQLPFDYPDEIS